MKQAIVLAIIAVLASAVGLWMHVEFIRWATGT